MRGVDDDEVGPRFHQRLGPLLGVRPDTDRGTDHEPAVGVLGGVGKLLALDEVLDGDQPAQSVLAVHQRQLLDLVLAQQPERFLAVHPDRSCDQRHRCHDVADAPPAVVLEAHVAVGHDSGQAPIGVHDGRAGDAVVGAELLDVGEGVVGAAGDRVGDHPRFGTLHQVGLGRLVVDGEVAVQHARTALAGHGNGHTGLGDGVHRRGQERDTQVDAAREPGAGIGVAGLQVRVARQQQDVVVGESWRQDLVVVPPVFLRHGDLPTTRAYGSILGG